ncbi:hypothetical protein A3D85_01410 [Candidatus Amesbacteria bacterium RIFCSPHIGHO2_02_FULL_47_9]|uniref:HTH cro/C1-type domain-containing protein n=1 Tax=Candidatus Amesbacteria bacterium RIFCSPHIGHO2_01_FULL_48_32b TaxID=1797253 RepID=A0A1F4YG87_9BACT|nr:MAG: hypothetical protein A2876_00445 [Candidatus Amesbacteria bacterium RIFCSPHIGHO2_01_FULL_48_32b]OGD05079.1 MAG: hypothetical protein A3D85_01410 [Candidatus Amesbacteria bacterium RIFCSPHIGHO2_02_FULL_47_9]OGD07512.1 MAG: hypothetical protein A2899_04390 [Candidatus Amesbacteria bacterium RIFCSPLOWO2_01_FULL_49_25]
MKTAGQILQSARLAKKLEIEDISRITKIRPNFLLSIEADDYSRLPSTVARGFIRNYAKILDLKPETILAVFRRDFIETSAGHIVPRGLAQPAQKPNFWTPKTTVIAALVCVFFLFGAYLIYQYRLLTGPPSLTITAPADLTSTTSDNMEVTGLTDPEAALYVNNQLISLDNGGHFSFRIPLVLGENLITITASGKSGKSTTLTRSVILTTGN